MTTNFTKAFYTVCFLATISLNAWSLAVVRRLYKEKASQPPGVDTGALSRLNHEQLRDGSEPLLDTVDQHRPVLLYLFSPFDCPEAIEELAELQHLRQERSDIDIRAIALYESAEEVNETRQRFHLTYPIVSDVDGRFKRLLSPPQTPWKVVYEPKTLRVLSEDGPSVTSEEKVAFHYHVLYLMRALASSGSKP